VRNAKLARARMKLELADPYVPPSTQFCTAEIVVHPRTLRGFLIAPLESPSDVDLARNNLAVIITSRVVRDKFEKARGGSLLMP